MKIAGLDLSITSSAVTILELEDFEVKKCYSFGFTETKKYSADNIIYYNNDDFVNPYDKYMFMINHILEWTKDADYVAIEDYAYGATGAVGMIFSLGEFEGYIKLSLYNRNQKIRLYAINQIKKFFTGFGQADKISMYQSFMKLDTIKPDISNLKAVNNGHGVKTTSDIVDSFAIVYMLLSELKWRNNLKNENEYQKMIFEGHKKEIGYINREFLFKSEN